jgi:hypothetical protein
MQPMRHKPFGELETPEKQKRDMREGPSSFISPAVACALDFSSLDIQLAGIIHTSSGEQPTYQIM